MSLKPRNGTYFDIFTQFVTEDLINKVMARYPEESLIIGNRSDSDRPQRMKLRYTYVWTYIAIQVRIVAKQHRSTENNPIQKILRVNLQEAKTHFEVTGTVPGINIIEHLSSIILFDEMEDILNENFQKLAESLGQCVAGDEKLFHFTGESKDVRLCISKPDRIGLWFYQLCALLRSGKPLSLIHI